MEKIFLFFLGSAVTYFLMNKKDRVNLKRDLIDEAKEESDDIDRLLNKEISGDNFAESTYLLQSICMKILDGIISPNTLKYNYLPLIKTIIDKELIEHYSKKYNLEYNRKDYLYLDKVYKMFKLEKEEIKLPFYWRLKIFFNNI